MKGNDVGLLLVVVVVMCALALPIYEMYRVFFGFDQWGMLSREYPTIREHGATVRCWISLRFPPFRQSLSKSGEFWDGGLTVTPRGLQVSAGFADFLRPTLLIPWIDVAVIGRRGHYEYDGGGVFLCFVKVPTVRMRISGKAMDALLKAGSPWSIAPDGAIVAKDS